MILFVALVPILSASDTDNHNIRFCDLQRQVMRKFVAPSPHSGVNENTDFCLMNGITCIDGVIKDIVCGIAVSPDSGTIDMAWIPSTVERIHFQNVRVAEGWSAPLLPRELKYFFLHRCHEANAFMRMEAKLSLLPEKLQEFFCLHSALHGPIQLSALPRDLRIFAIHRVFGDRVLVDVETLPLGLRYVHNYAVNDKSAFFFSDKGNRAHSRVVGDTHFACTQIRLSKLDTRSVDYRALSRESEEHRALILV